MGPADLNPEERARKLLSRAVYDYYAGGAGSEKTLHENIRAFEEIHFIPRCLRDVTSVSTSTLLSQIGRLAFPALIAPMAMQAMVHEKGECAVASAARRSKIPFILSTYSTTSIEEVAKVHSCLLFQLYLYKTREISANLLRRARISGYKAIVLTVDAVRYGRRVRDEKNRFKLPAHLSLKNFETTRNHFSDDSSTELQNFEQNFESRLQASDIAWIAQTSKLPVWVKGVLHPEDAVAAVEAGASGIVVSNHGGRQLDGTVPTMRVLPSIVKAVQGRALIIVDSGVRHGEDILRALCYGANAVLIGRPVLWALVEGGEDKVFKLLQKFQAEFDLAMALCGISSVDQIDRSLVTVGNRSKL